jgi:hypothetical protein
MENVIALCVFCHENIHTVLWSTLAGKPMPKRGKLFTVLSSGRARTFRGLDPSFLLAGYERESGVHCSIAIVSSRFDF